MKLTRTLQGDTAEALAPDARQCRVIDAEQLARTRLIKALDLLSGSAKRLELQRNRLVHKLNEFLAEHSSEALAMKLADFIDELEELYARGDRDLDQDGGAARPGRDDAAFAHPLLRWWHVGAEPSGAGVPPPARQAGALTVEQMHGARSGAPFRPAVGTGSTQTAVASTQAATRLDAAMAVLHRTVGEAIAAGGVQGFGAVQIISLPPYARIPSGMATANHHIIAARNMNGLLARGGGDIFDYVFATQTPAMMRSWTSENHAIFAGSFADPLSVNELAYMGEFLPDTAFVRAETLSAERLEEARRMYGSGRGAALSLANHLNRLAILDHLRASIEMSADQDRARASNRLDAARLSAQRVRGSNAGNNALHDEGAIRGSAARFAGLLSVLGSRVLSYRTGMTLGHGGALSTPAGQTQGVRSHEQCRGDLASGRLHAERLNVAAAFQGVLDETAAFSVALQSASLADAASGQAQFLACMDRFWSLYPEGSKDVREGRRPTNADYGAALEVALQEAGYTAQDARPLAAVARSERVLCGLLDHEPVPMIPARLAC
jgi:hypothetical protein